MQRKTKYLLMAVGAAIGALGGFLYWKYIGCISGTCAITSNPLNSTAYFALLGLLLINIFIPASTAGKNSGQQS